MISQFCYTRTLNLKTRFSLRKREECCEKYMEKMSSPKSLKWFHSAHATDCTYSKSTHATNKQTMTDSVIDRAYPRPQMSENTDKKKSFMATDRGWGGKLKTFGKEGFWEHFPSLLHLVKWPALHQMRLPRVKVNLVKNPGNIHPEFNHQISRCNNHKRCNNHEMHPWVSTYQKIKMWSHFLRFLQLGHTSLLSTS